MKLRALALFLVAACGGASTPNAASPGSAADVTIVVPKPPAIARFDGKRHLLYELVVINPSGGPVVVESIDIDAGSFGQKKIADSDLRAKLKPVVPADADAVPDLRPVGKTPDAEPREVPARGVAAIFLRLQTLDDDAALPPSIKHTVAISDGVKTITRSVDVAPAPTPELVLGPPLDGPGWFGSDGPVDTSQHRRTILRFRGSWHVGQRFAVDWTRCGDDGALVRPRTPNDDNASYLGFGADVHAVADATVAAVKDGIGDNAGDRGLAASTPLTLDNEAGNSVVLDLGDGRFAAYAHLRPGSLRVARGDRVRRGQVVAQLGNSGNSGLPHLHFQVCDAPSFLACEGVPYVMESFAHAPTDDAGAKTGPYAPARHELMYTHHAIDFGAARITLPVP